MEREIGKIPLDAIFLFVFITKHGLCVRVGAIWNNWKKFPAGRHQPARSSGWTQPPAACAELAQPCWVSRNTPVVQKAWPRSTRDVFVCAHGNSEGDQARLLEIGRLQKMKWSHYIWVSFSVFWLTITKAVWPGNDRLLFFYWFWLWRVPVGSWGGRWGFIYWTTSG